MAAKNRKNSDRRRSGYYWQSDSTSTIQGFVEVLPIKITKINEYYHQRQSNDTRKLIGDLFLQKNVPKLVNKPGKAYLFVDHIYDETEAAQLQIWSRLCEYPPTHCVVVGYLANRNRAESAKLTVSLGCVGDRQSWATQLIGMVITRLIDGSRDNYLLTPRQDNSEFWLQCVFAVVCSIRES